MRVFVSVDEVISLLIPNHRDDFAFIVHGVKIHGLLCLSLGLKNNFTWTHYKNTLSKGLVDNPNPTG
jgi:hypothetical protein